MNANIYQLVIQWAAIPLRPEVCRVVKSDSHARGESESNDPVPVYYPGTEISGFMPRRGDFAVVRLLVLY